MQVEIKEEMSQRIKRVSEILGFKKEEVVDRALLFYLDTIQKQLNLKQELNEWDMLSDEALINFEKSL